MYRSRKIVEFFSKKIHFLLTYLVFIKNPAKTKRGRTIGTTNAPAASGDGAATPMTDPSK
jgi:hypothetical protein